MYAMWKDLRQMIDQTWWMERFMLEMKIVEHRPDESENAVEIAYQMMAIVRGWC